MNIISIRKRIVDTDVVNNVTDTRQSFITRVVIRFLWHDVIHRITATSCDKGGAGDLEDSSQSEN